MRQTLFVDLEIIFRRKVSKEEVSDVQEGKEEKSRRYK